MEGEQVDNFKYLESYVTEDIICSYEIKIKISIVWKHLTGKQSSSVTMNKAVRKKLAKCCLEHGSQWSGSLTLTKVYERRIEDLKMWIWRKVVVVSWVDS